jgi:hypothetical protein
MKSIMWHGSKIGMLNDDGTLLYGSPVVEEMFGDWADSGGIVRLSGPDTSTDIEEAHVADVLPITLENVDAEFALVGFTIVDG